MACNKSSTQNTMKRRREPIHKELDCETAVSQSEKSPPLKFVVVEVPKAPRPPPTPGFFCSSTPAPFGIDWHPDLNSAFPIRSQGVIIKNEAESSKSDDSVSENEEGHAAYDSFSRRTDPVSKRQPNEEQQASASGVTTATINNKNANLVNFGPGVFFTCSSTRGPTSNANTEAAHPKKLFCFHCKEYGHLRESCRNPWSYWWPSEYLNRNPWLKKKVNRLRHLRWSGKTMEYREEMIKLENRVAGAESRSSGPINTQREVVATNSPTLHPSLATRRQGNREILHARRRCQPFFVVTNRPSSLGHQGQCCKFEFDQKNLIDDLQRQVTELRLTLMLQQNCPSANLPAKMNNFQRPTQRRPSTLKRGALETSFRNPWYFNNNA